MRSFFKKPDHPAFEHPCLETFFFSCSRTDKTPLHSCICYADALCPDPCYEGRYDYYSHFEAFLKEFHTYCEAHMALIACGIGLAHMKVLKISFPV